MGYYNSFVVKIWTENGRNLTRGYIQHVGTQESVCFADWEKVLDFISKHLSWQIDHGVSEGVEQLLPNAQGDQSNWPSQP